MRNYIFVALLVGLCSCGTINNTCYYTKTHYFGDVVLLNDNGDTIRQWKQTIIGVEDTDPYNAKKNWFIGNDYGMSFIDNQGKSVYVRGGIAIIDNVKQTIATKEFHVTTDTEKADIANFEQKYNVLKASITKAEKEIVKSDDSKFIAIKKEQIKGLRQKMNEIAEYLQRQYNYNIED